MRNLIAAVTVFELICGIAAYNTMEGAGEDIEHGGKKLERSADENK